MSIEQDGEGGHHLDAPLVTSPWADERLRDESLVEGAVADAALPGVATAELVDVDLAGDARAQALDLSLADARFAPDVLAAAARRAAESWADAVDGDDAPLAAVATPDASTRSSTAATTAATAASSCAVRGSTSVAIERSTRRPEPARMTLAVRVRGRRYVEDRDTAAVAVRQQGPRDGLHRALDDGARRHRRDAVAARRRRRLTPAPGQGAARGAVPLRSCERAA